MAAGLDRLRRAELRAAMALFAAAVLAVGIANSTFAPLLAALLAWPIAGTPFTVHLAINDGLMAIFFFVVGLELKKELIEGRLSTLRRAAQPLIAAAAGMLVPALIFIAVTRAHPEMQRGWAVPAATDIAFALGALALLGRRVRSELRVFLLALAVADDLGAILIIALYYSEGVRPLMLLGAFGVWAAALLFNRLGGRALWAYAVLGALLWGLVLASGVHPTLAGVLLAFAIPHRSHPSLVNQLQLRLHGFVSYVVMPLFALANAGVPLRSFGGDALAHPVALGAALGLVIGKTLGITLAAWLSARLLHEKPVGTVREMLGLACLAGIGFTMSLFIAGLAYRAAPELMAQARAGIFVGSLVSATLGILVLARSRVQVGSL